MVRKGFFYSLDALIAVMLILAVLVLIPVFYINKEEATNPVYYSSDIIQLLSTLTLVEINNSDVQTLLNTSNITNYNRSIIEQVLRFQVAGDEYRAQKLLNLTIEGLTPRQFTIGVYIEGYSDPLFVSSNNSVHQLISSKQMISGIEKDRAVEGLTSRVFLSGINEMTSSVYIYFGGYIGEGNITRILQLPSGINDVTSGYLELDASANFTLFLNGEYAGYFGVSATNASNLSADHWDMEASYLLNLHSGANTVELFFNDTSHGYIGGGYIRFTYASTELDLYNDAGESTYWFPGIEGIINVYDSFYVPGTLHGAEIFLHLLSNAPVFLSVGNSTIVEINASASSQQILLNSTYISSLLDFTSLGMRTVPLRLGIRNVSFTLGGKSDAVLTTDRTGSMNACDVEISCSTPGICDSTATCHERRDKVAQSSDRTFINEMLSVEGNTVGLIGYGMRSNPVCSFTYLTDENNTLQQHIDDYYGEWCGYTCISCGIVSAAELLVENKMLHGSNQKTAEDQTEYHVGDSGPVSVTENLDLTVNHSAFVKAQLNVFARSIDTENNYKDCVFFNDHYLGRLCESNDDGSTGWHTCSYPILEEWLPSSGAVSGLWSISSQAEFQQCSLSDIDVNSVPGSAQLNLEGAWMDSDYTKRRKLTFDNSAQSEILEGFPVIISLDNSRVDYSQTQNQGQDLRFTNSAGMLLPYEIEKWNESGISSVWVKVPSIAGSSNADYVWMYYGNPAAADNQSSSVWGDYAAVWHMASNQDSSPNNNDLSCTNCPAATGSSYWYDGSNDRHLVANSNLINTGGPWDNKTIEILFKADTIGSGASKDILYEQGSSTKGLNLYVTGTSLYVGGWNRDSSQSNWDGTWLSAGINTGTWYYAVLGLQDGDNSACADCLKGFLNGQEFSSGDGRRLYSNTGNIQIGFGDTRMHSGTSGEDDYDGFIDELRLTNKALSADWIKAQYLSLTDSFISYGDEEVEAGISQSYVPTGLLLSPVFDSGGSATWGTITWTESVPPGTDIVIEIRTGNSASPDATWDNYGWGDSVYTSSGIVAQAPGRYIQWRANMSTTDGNVTPLLQDVSISYSVEQTGTNNITLTGANIYDCFGTSGEQDDWDFKNVQLVAWEWPVDIQKSNHFLAGPVTLGESSLSYTTSFNPGVMPEFMKSGVLTFDALGSAPNYYDCVFVNNNYIGRMDEQRYYEGNLWNNVSFDVPLYALNDSTVDIRITSGTVDGCQLTSGTNDGWQFQNLNFTLRWSNTTYTYDRYMSMLVMSDGQANTKIGHRSSYDSANADNEAVQKACRAFEDYGIRIYSVAFGSGAETGTMQSIACCDDCSHAYNANNAEELTSIYSTIANNIIELQFEEQAANITGNISTILYTDSYISLDYTPEGVSSQYGRLPVTLESDPFGNSISAADFEVPPGTVVYDAKLTSYSGQRWTDRAAIKNETTPWNYFYNLSHYGLQYSLLGDPYTLNVPISYVSSGNNSVYVSTAQGPGNISIGSPDNRVIYTLGIDLQINYTGVFGSADGCTWTVTFDDGSQTTVPIPETYTGSKTCIFTNTSNCNIDHNTDAIDNAVCHLFSQLDFDDDGMLFVKFGSGDIGVESFSIGKIPFMWGPTIFEVRVWK